MNPFVTANLTPIFKNKRVLLGITGSIAAFKAIDLIRTLRDLGAEVKVVVTANALQFVTKTTLETLSSNTLASEMFGPQGTHHITTARWADIALIAPATANTIAGIALGVANDLLTTELLAFQGPLFIAPAMNPTMYANPAVQANIQTLMSRGIVIVGPTSGDTACKEEGYGRMVEPPDILTHVATHLTLKKTCPSSGKRIVITLGPTRSSLDPVRYITNHSSGKMGACLAWEAFRRGYAVTIIAGPCEYAEPHLLPPHAEIIAVKTTAEMREQALRAVNQNDTLAYLSAAAVLDWDIADESEHKIKKQKGRNTPLFSLTENPDILKEVCATRRPGLWVLGFAAETKEHRLFGKKKMLSKGCDFLFANDVTHIETGFGSDQNGGVFFERTAPGQALRSVTMTPMNKIKLATKLFNRMERAWFMQADEVTRAVGTQIHC